MAAFDPRIVSERWADWRARVDLDEYDQRWVRMEESGRASHGEADLIAALGVAPVLDAGCAQRPEAMVPLGFISMSRVRAE